MGELEELVANLLIGGGVSATHQLFWNSGSFCAVFRVESSGLNQDVATVLLTRKCRVVNPNCIYNCGADSSSTQEYHLYPASASTLDLVLPPGVVCDSCNAYFSKIESYFVHHHPGSSMRVWDGVKTRKGKTPRYLHEDGEMTRVDGEHGREISTQLGNVRFERQPNGDFTIVGSYAPPPFDASKISRVLHKMAFEILVGYAENREWDPRKERFSPLRDFVRRPKSATHFQPFAWKRIDGKQEVPMMGPLKDADTDQWIADVVQLTFPGVAYLVAYPPWPTPERVWDSIQGELNVVSVPGMTTLKPEEIRMPMQLRRKDSGGTTT